MGKSKEVELMINMQLFNYTHVDVDENFFQTNDKSLLLMPEKSQIVRHGQRNRHIGLNFLMLDKITSSQTKQGEEKKRNFIIDRYGELNFLMSENNYQKTRLSF